MSRKKLQKTTPASGLPNHFLIFVFFTLVYDRSCSSAKIKRGKISLKKKTHPTWPKAKWTDLGTSVSTNVILLTQNNCHKENDNNQIYIVKIVCLL